MTRIAVGTTPPPLARARCPARSVPRTAAGPARRSSSCTGSPTPGAPGSWCWRASSASTTSSPLRSPATPAARRSAASWRSSSPPATAPARSSRSLPAAAGRSGPSVRPRCCARSRRCRSSFDESLRASMRSYHSGGPAHGDDADRHARRAPPRRRERRFHCSHDPGAPHVALLIRFEFSVTIAYPLVVRVHALRCGVAGEPFQ